MEMPLTKEHIMPAVLIGVGILLGMLIMTVTHDYDNRGLEHLKPDTSYNKIKLDSIKVQIGKHDTTIYKLNIKLKDDIEKSYNLNDSSTVDLFKKLSSEKSNY